MAFKRYLCNIFEFAIEDCTVWTIARLLGRYQTTIHPFDQAYAGKYVPDSDIFVKQVDWGSSIECAGLDK